MFDLFRYMEWRLPEGVGSDSPAIRIAGDSQLRTKLREARSSDDPVKELARVAAEFAESGSFAMHAGALQFAGAFSRVSTAARDWDAENSPPLADLLLTAYDVELLTALTQSPRFEQDKTCVGDSLLAAKILGPAREQDLPSLLGFARAIELTERAARSDPLLANRSGIDQILNALVVIPAEYLAIDRQPAPRTPAPTGDDGRPAEIERLQQRLHGLMAAYDHLTGLDATVLSAPEHRPADTASARGETSGTVRVRRGGLLDRFLDLFRPADVQAPLLGEAGEARLTLRTDVLRQAPVAIQTVLSENRIDPTQTPLPAVVSKLQSELTTVQNRLFELAPLKPQPVYQLGQYFFTISGQPMLAPVPLTPPPQVKIRPVGFGDLQVVKQQIVRYEAGELSYIENILKGEQLDRVVRRRELEEEVTTVEKERIKEEERDLQSTDRFELRTEAENTARTSTTTTSGNTVTSQYGNFVETHGNTFARDTVNRAVNRLTERVREQRTIRLQRELVEKTAHSYTNEDAQHIRGLYQWVDKIYQAQIYNFGNRLLYEAVIPEPAAFVLAMRKRAMQPEGLQLKRPVEPTFGPSELNAWSYLYYATLYDVVGAVEPPPPEYVNVPHGIRDAWDAEHLMYNASSIAVPEGYAALSIQYYSDWRTWSMNNAPSPELIVGRFSRIGGPLNLAGETGTLPIFVAAHDVVRFVINLMVVCRRLPEHFEKWQIRTYETLMKGYRKQLAEFEQRLANVQALGRAQMLLGGGDARHREIEQTELKKAFLTLLTNQQFDLFGGIETAYPYQYPQTDVQAAVNQAGFISFFERAFEWQNMLYFFYPYFWGRKAEWEGRVGIQEVDPQFEAFLKAGAARVVVPVRPGFEAAIAHYVETGEVWLGETGPDMYSELFVSILQEIKDRDKAPGEETPVGDPWEVRLPTTLVRLRDDASLPEWKRDASGKWVPKA